MYYRSWWNQEHQVAFHKLKGGLSLDTVLAYFDTEAQHEVDIDGCPIGVSATLVQKKNNQDHGQVIQYRSRALTNTEKKYSQIELEMLAVDFGCRKFHSYLYGKPLEIIFNNARHQTLSRLQQI